MHLSSPVFAATLYGGAGQWETKGAAVVSAILTASLHTGSILRWNYQHDWMVRRAKVKPIQKHRRVLLIDESGNNLGEMDSKIALGLAEGQGLTVMEIKEGDSKSKCPTFKVVSKKELSADEKIKRSLAMQKKKEDMVKEIKLGTRISDHDMDVKMRNIRNILSKGITVRLSVESKRRRGITKEEFAQELARRPVILGDVTKKLSGVATMVNKPGKVKKGNVVAEFKPVPLAGGVESVPEVAVAESSPKGVELPPEDSQRDQSLTDGSPGVRDGQTEH